MKKYVLTHKRTMQHYRTESSSELAKKLEIMKSGGEDLDDSIVIEMDAEDLKNRPPSCKTAADFLRSAWKKP